MRAYHNLNAHQKKFGARQVLKPPLSAATKTIPHHTGGAELEPKPLPQLTFQQEQSLIELIEEGRRQFWIRFYILASLILILLLLLIGLYLFGPLYVNDNYNECKHLVYHLKNRTITNCTAEIAAANTTITNDLQEVFLTLSANNSGLYNKCLAEPTTGIGLGGPPTNSSAPPGSTYVNSNTSTLYYRAENGTWITYVGFTNSSQTLQNGTCALPTCVNDLQGWSLWNASQIYNYGNIVSLGNNAYVALNSSIGASPDLSPSNWQLLIFNVTGQPGRSGQQGYAGGQGPPGICDSVTGTWQNNTLYTNGQIVVYNRSLYISDNTSLDVPPDSNSTLWSLFAVAPVPIPGANGTNGVNGIDGRDGLNGTNGINGINGTNGIDGTNGFNGTNGRNGLNGTDGINGTNGQNGLNGADAVGLSFSFAWNVTTYYVTGNFVSYANAFYFALVNNTGVLPNSNSSVWALGPQAVNGANGTNGINGKDGSNGTNGINGMDGQNGTNGINGIDGINGTNGYSVLYNYTYNPSTTYTYGDGVTYNNSVYFAIATSTGVTPGTNSTAWSLPVTSNPGQQGNSGYNGTNGINGVNGTSCPLYNGSVPVTGPYYYGVSYQMQTYPALANNATVVLKYDQLVYDPNAWYNMSSGFFSPNISGWYQFYATVTIDVPNTSTLNPLSVYMTASYTAIGGSIGVTRLITNNFLSFDSYISTVTLSTTFNGNIYLDGTRAAPTGQLVLSVNQINNLGNGGTVSAIPNANYVTFMKIS